VITKIKVKKHNELCAGRRLTHVEGIHLEFVVDGGMSLGVLAFVDLGS
jgi:hypothetical protein